jgi:hypothetical protein
LVVREEGCTEREADCFRVSVDGSPHFFSGWVLEGAGESSSLAFGV